MNQVKRMKIRNPMKNKETRLKMSNTRKRLYKEGKIKPWAKGLTKETDERLKKLSLDRIGKNNPMFGVKGKIHPTYKRKHTKEERLKISIAKKGKSPWNKGKKGCYSSGSFKKGHKTNIGRKTSGEIKEKIRFAQLGEKGNNWQGGKSFEPYSPEFNSLLKEHIRQRDNYRCQECFIHQDKLFTKDCKGRMIKQKLSIHHIDFNKKNNHPNNLISLCNSCHQQTNWNRDGWIIYYQNKIKHHSRDYTK